MIDGPESGVEAPTSALRACLLCVPAAALLGYVAVAIAGASVALPVGVGIALSGLLGYRLLSEPADLERLNSHADAAVAVGLFAAIVYLGFNSGGFSPGTTALAAFAFGLVLMVRTALAAQPLLYTRGPAARGASLGLLLLLAWVLLSTLWSGALERALDDATRDALYLFVVVLFASLGGSRRRVRPMLLAVAAGLLAICVGGLVSRLAPQLLVTLPTPYDDRLGYPVGYWNAMGVIAAFGALCTLHLTSDLNGSRATKVAAAAAAPLFVATLMLTFSRAALVLLLLGALVYLLTARPRGGLVAVLTVGPPLVVVALFVLSSNALASSDPRTAEAIAEGRVLAAVLVLAAALAALSRLTASRFDARLASARFRSLPRELVVALVVGLVIGLGAAAVVADLPARISAAVAERAPGSATATSDRLASLGSQGRLEQWSVAVGDFRDHPLIGTGAGTWGFSFSTERASNDGAFNAHSLYLESLSELGLVGGVLILVVVGLLLVPLAVRVARSRETEPAAVLALGLLWAVHAAVDWDWEMPAVTLPVLALLAAVSGGEPASRPDRRGPWMPLAAIALVAAALVPPLLILLSAPPAQRSLAAFRRGDCSAAIANARATMELPAGRVQPWLVIGYCEAVQGQRVEARRAMRAATALEPRGWEGHYGEAVAAAYAGADPWPALRRSFAADPRGPLNELAERLLADYQPLRPADLRAAAEQMRAFVGTDGPLIPVGDLTQRTKKGGR